MQSIQRSAAGGFSNQLKQWRAQRRRSQLALSLEAGISQRHLSFLESGRAAPSRAMVLQLAEALELPLRERNALLTAAGFAAVFRETKLDGPQMQPIREALQKALNHHSPYPAVVVDKAWNVLLTNDVLLQLFGLIDGFSETAQRICGDGPINLFKLSFHPDGLRAYTDNWQQVALHLLNRLHREARETDSQILWALAAEVLTYDGVPEQWQTPDWEMPPEPVLTVDMQFGEQSLRLFSMIATFGTPQDITTDELRLELMFPGDDDSRALLQALANSPAE